MRIRVPCDRYLATLWQVPSGYLFRPDALWWVPPNASQLETHSHATTFLHTLVYSADSDDTSVSVFHVHLLQVLELFGVEGEESVSLLSGSGGINSGSTDGDSEDKAEEVVEPRPSRVFYCVAMACASAFAAMAMTSWASTDG